MAQNDCAKCGGAPTVERTVLCRACYADTMDRMHAKFWGPTPGKSHEKANKIGRERKARTKARLERPPSPQPDAERPRALRPPRTIEQKIDDCVAALEAAGGGPLSAKDLAELVGWPGLKAAKESGRIVMQTRYGYFLPENADPNYVPAEDAQRVKVALSDGPKLRKELEAETDVSRWLLKKLEASGRLVKLPGRDSGYEWRDAA